MFTGLLITFGIVVIIGIVIACTALVSALMVDVTPLDFGDDEDV